MRRIKLVILAATAICALSAIMSASAFAKVEILPLEKVTFTGESAKVTHLGILEHEHLTECSSVKYEGEIEGSGTLGPLHLDFKGCKTNVGGTCTGLGEASGVILSNGTVHVVTDKTLTHGYVLFLVEHTHYSCTVLFVTALVLVLGEYLCLIEPLTLGAKKTVKCERGANDGDPKVTEYENAEGKQVTLANPLVAAENEATETMASEEGEAEANFSHAVELMV
jgi:hypothetical protein